MARLPYTKDLLNGEVVGRTEEPCYDRLDAVGFMIDKVLDILALVNEKQFESTIKPFYELCLLSKKFQDEAVCHKSFVMFVRMLTFMDSI